jgi:hypothetical protein
MKTPPRFARPPVRSFHPSSALRQPAPPCVHMLQNRHSRKIFTCATLSQPYFKCLSPLGTDTIPIEVKRGSVQRACIHNAHAGEGWTLFSCKAAVDTILIVRQSKEMRRTWGIF